MNNISEKLTCGELEILLGALPGCNMFNAALYLWRYLSSVVFPALCHVLISQCIAL